MNLSARKGPAADPHLSISSGVADDGDAVCGQIRPASARPDGECDLATLEAQLPFTQRKFIAAYVGCGSVSIAVALSGCSRATHYKALKHSAAYRLVLHEVQEVLCDRLRATASLLALDGLERRKFCHGKPCQVPVIDEDGNVMYDEFGEPLMEDYVEVVYNTRVLLAMMKARCPEYANI